MNKTQKTILIILLIVLSVIVRLQVDHQSGFDSYWLHAQAESIQTYNYAIWVFHPASLFGYYPESYPSGTMFFLAMFSQLTGLTIEVTVFLTSILIGLLITLLTFVLSKELFTKWTWQYVSALTVSLSPIIVTYTSYTASGRIFIIPFYLLFIWSIIKLEKSRNWNYLGLIAISFLFSLFIHRTSQLMIIFILSGIGAWFYEKIPQITNYIKNHRHYKKHIHPRYEKNKYYLLLDLGILFFIAAIAKVSDLIVRNRLDDNIQKVINPATELLVSEKSEYIFILFFIVLIIFAVSYLFFRYFKKVNIIKKPFELFHHHFNSFFEKPEKYFIIALGLFTLILFMKQFFGSAIYAPSIDDYASTDLFSGTSPIVILINMVVNYTTTVTPLFLFSFIGFFYLLIKKNKNYSDWLFIFIFIGFSGILLDKKYVRLFITPLLGIYITFGIIGVLQGINKLIKKQLLKNISKNVVKGTVVFLLILSLLTPLGRLTFLDDYNSFQDVKEYEVSGEYLNSLDCDCSFFINRQTPDVVVLKESKIFDLVFIVYEYLHDENMVVEEQTFNDLKSKFLSGRKVSQIWILNDWFFTGQYYIGKHAKALVESEIFSETAEKITEAYKFKYYGYVEGDDDKYFESMSPLKNKIYESPKISFYDVQRGRE